jgi:hypothetical protein
LRGREKVKRVGIITAFLMLLMALSASVALATSTTTINFANAPMGTHFVQGTPAPTCTVTATTVTCPTEAFELAGVGNTNATATLTAEYSAIVDCFNPGVNPNNPVESHTQTVSVESTSGLLSPKNGRLTISPLTVTAPTAADFQALATCPNPNWTAVVRPGSIELVSFAFTVTFEGFSAPAITITGNDP